MNNRLFSYDNMYLVPKHSSLKSRADANTTIDLCGWKFCLPVVPANMEDVIDRENAFYLSENGYFYIFHRFGKYGEGDATHSFIANANENKWKLISASIGTGKDSETILHDVEGFRVDFWTVDVAHADHDNVKPIIHLLKMKFPKSKIIAGNVATADGYRFLCDLGVDVVKISIGSGSICTTRYQTGFHLPTAYSVWECAQVGRDIPIIADGGAKHYGDIAKALVLGADMVMSGGWFASCIDSPAKIQNGKKVYRGSTSYEAKGMRKHIEGKTLELDEGTTYIERLEEIRQAICSSISYAGGNDLTAFNSVEWHLL